MKTISINNNKVFQRAYKHGKSFALHNLVIYAIHNSKKKLRIGITASKKIGKAHDRNRAKRLVRAAFAEIIKENPDVLKKSIDIVFVCRVKTTISKCGEVKKSMNNILKRLNVYD